MRSRVVLCSLMVVAVVALGLVHAQDAAPTYTKQAMCIACHKAMNKTMVEQYLTTKHSQAAPTADMKPVDIYRRSVGFNSADNTYFEAGVGCQDCHGAGSDHLKAKSKEDKLAAIVRPAELKTQQQKLSLCGRCHGQYTIGDKAFADNFKAGDDLFAIPGFKLTDVTGPGPFQQLNDLQSSKHAQNDVNCMTCHTAHEATEASPQLRKKVPDLCLGCHTDAHKCTVKADQIPANANCVTCHMPDGRHTFKVNK